MTHENNLRVAQQLYAAFGRGDVPAVIEGLDPNITWVNPGPSDISYFGTHHGRDQVARGVFGFIGENMNIEKFEITNMLANGDMVVALLHMETTMRKTGRRVVQRAAHVWTFTAGRPTHFHDFQDNAAVATALRA